MRRRYSTPAIHVSWLNVESLISHPNPQREDKKQRGGFRAICGMTRVGSGNGFAKGEGLVKESGLGSQRNRVGQLECVGKSDGFHAMNHRTFPFSQHSPCGQLGSILSALSAGDSIAACRVVCIINSKYRVVNAAMSL